MRRFQKKQLLDIMQSLRTIHEKAREKLEQKDYESFHIILEGCQSNAIKIGEAIEQIEGEGTEVVTCLERYCESVYQISTQAGTITPKKASKILNAGLIKAENALKHMTDRIEAVFLPYKASMWDSLESVWMAADKDPDCDAYVIPIPYFDKNRDGSFKEVHYEGGEFPDYVPITHYDDYNFESRRPDMIFIHNPYDQYNNVTSVHPFFYSLHLKQFTDMLVYIPYYSTSGGMSPGQGQCSAYYAADYIVVQAEKYRKYFAPDIPKEKLLSLGSPKFDRIVNVCNNPPEPPQEWKVKMAGKKVYFYNTSINGMLANTLAFLKKMEYVFSCFAGRQDACLLWRPHPLLESTFDSMRSEYKPAYEALKKYFMESDFGIYDDTPDIAYTIANCDAYIGDAASSVTSLFGIVGKPVFVLDNNIDCAPGEDDWRGEIVKGYTTYGKCDRWVVTQGNKLFYSPDNDYKYTYCFDLLEGAYRKNYYISAVHEINGKGYVCPSCAQDILVISNNKVEKKVVLERRIEQNLAFYGAVDCGDSLFLIPNNYPAVVEYNTITGELKYYDQYLDIITEMVQGERRIGGFCVYKDFLFIASATSDYVVAICPSTGKEQVLSTNSDGFEGCVRLYTDGIDLWFLPFSVGKIVRWNPESGEKQEYGNYPKGLLCKYSTWGYECMDRPFSSVAFYGEYVYLAPYWANMYLKIDKRTGEILEWTPPFEELSGWKNGYFSTGIKSNFVRPIEGTGGKVYRMFSFFDRKMYDVNLETNEYQEIAIEFNLGELCENEVGFAQCSEWLQYACVENAFNSLQHFLDGKIIGAPFDKDIALRAYERVAANNDGTSGTKIYYYVLDRVTSC